MTIHGFVLKIGDIPIFMSILEGKTVMKMMKQSDGIGGSPIFRLPCGGFRKVMGYPKRLDGCGKSEKKMDDDWGSPT